MVAQGLFVVLGIARRLEVVVAVVCVGAHHAVVAAPPGLAAVGMEHGHVDMVVKEVVERHAASPVVVVVVGREAAPQFGIEVEVLLHTRSCTPCTMTCLPFVLTEKGAQEVGNDVYSILCVLRQGLCRAGYMHLPIDSGFQ